MLAQELVRQLYRRPRVTKDLIDTREARMGPASLGEFLEWLWPLTAAPQRLFRANAMWLHKHLAPLLLSGDEAGKLADYNAMTSSPIRCRQPKLNSTALLFFCGSRVLLCLPRSLPTLNLQSSLLVVLSGQTLSVV